MADNAADRLKDAALAELKRQAARRVCLWALAGGAPILGGFLVVLITVIASTALLAGVGHWLSSIFGPHPPAIATSTSRPTEWLSPAITDSLTAGVPNTVVMAVMNQASDGQVYGDRWYCSNGQTTGEPCHMAYHPGLLGIGPKGVHHVGIGYGLMGLDGRDMPLPAGQHWHSVAWNLKEGIGRLAPYLREPDWQSGLQAFHADAQAPPGWTDTENYASTVKGLIERYSAAPTLGAWALAPWSHKTGQWEDPGNRPEWVFVVGAAPVGAPFRHTWKPPTITVSYNPRTGKSTRTVQYHMLSGHDLASPVLVIGVLKNGQKVTFDLSTLNKTIPVWPGGTVFGAKVPLLGPQALTSITATWPNPSGGNTTTETIQWPEQPTGAVSDVVHVADTQTVAHWWPNIEVASRQTGVPADWIAAEMANESGGHEHAGRNGLAGAYGLMQLEPGTAKGLPGYYPGARQNPQENLILGAEYLAELHAQFSSWRIASAAYYGGSGMVENAGVYPGMPWSEAAPRLNIVPFASAGNELTMAQYADNIEATSHAVAKMMAHHSQGGKGKHA